MSIYKHNEEENADTHEDCACWENAVRRNSEQCAQITQTKRWKLINVITLVCVIHHFCLKTQWPEHNAILWRRPGDPLATPWRRPGYLLATPWRPLVTPGDPLANPWRLPNDPLATLCRTSGETLIGPWQPLDEPPVKPDEPLVKPWRVPGDTLATPC